ncbi:hypothetical protein C0585_07860 [Candidatus Woesearchaeota archaeon]|nr:MAG: hypothetical protein C0585_07860 [Candidatus Woesearchaeota archaeon]
MVMLFFILLSANNSKKEELLSNLESQIVTNFEQENIKNYMNFCMEDIANDAFLYIGEQGGYIYDYQGGRTRLMYDNFANKNMYELVKGANLTYSIYYNITKNNTYISPPPPIYPTNPEAGNLSEFRYYSDSYHIMGANGKDAYIFYLGDVNMPKLCYYDGRNYNNSKDNIILGCKVYANRSLGEESIQEQLEYYMNNKLKECTEKGIEALGGLDGFEIDNAVKTDILFGDNNVDIDIKFNINIGLKGKSRLVMNEFSIKLPIRIKKIWNHLYSVLRDDSIKFSFDKTNRTNIERFSMGWDPSFSSYLYNLGLEKDLYELTDSKSLIGEGNFTFRTLIQNRRPALEYIENEYLSRVDMACYDIVTFPGIGNEIWFTPKGYDPDEDNLTYYYRGWREDYATNFDINCFFQAGGATCSNGHIEELLDCERMIPNSNPQDWTKSNQYQLSYQNASYSPTDADVGLHKVTIEVFDGALSDWQDVYILVLDVPTVVAELDNLYEDINNTYASIEDFFTINTSQSSAYMASLNDFWFKDVNESWNYTTDDVYFRLPMLLEETYPDIKTIGDLTSDDYRLFILGIHEFLIEASNGVAAGKDNFTFEVKECLPHRNPSADPFPYHNITTYIDDPFQADHTCCLVNDTDPKNASFWEIAEDDYVCFNKVQSGAYVAFTDEELREFYVETTETAPTHYVPGGGQDNDVFIRTFNRSCTGDRGNTCTGDIYDEFIVEPCDDDLGVGETARCSGPPMDIFDSPSYGSLSCVFYNGVTFEQLEANANGDSYSDSNLCNLNFKCTESGNGGDYSVSGDKFSCMATCGSFGCKVNTQCDPCYDVNSCTDNEGSNPPTSFVQKDYITGGYVTGEITRACSGGTCQGFDSYIQYDYCDSSTGKLMEAACVYPANSLKQPYNFAPYDCSTTYSAGCFGSGTDYFQRNGGKCNESFSTPDDGSGAACIEDTRIECDTANGYACKDSTQCTKTVTGIFLGCVDDGDCITGYYCSQTECHNGENGDRCDSNSDCISERCDFSGSVNLCYAKLNDGFGICDEASDCLSNLCNISGNQKCYS